MCGAVQSELDDAKTYVWDVGAELSDLMFLKKRKQSTDPQLRSLVQKAVRRGFSSVAKDALLCLEALGDRSWIRSRSAVIAAEECWPLLSELEPKSTIAARISWLARIAETEKHKDAAGLGTLAYNVSEDDLSVYDGTEDDRTIKIVAAGIKRPDDYWNWLVEEGRNKGVAWNVQKIRSFVPWATWPWDKAFIFASAYLVVERVGSTCAHIGCTNGEFPYWVAIDKHTDEGKIALRAVAKRLGYSYRQLNWVSYYCESARVEGLHESPWWEKEKRWRLGRVGLTSIEAEDIWQSARTLISEAVHDDAEALRSRIDCGAGSQLNL